jgi:hypothetical protein
MDFVSFEIAKKLKEKGFREKCFATYTPYGGIFKYNEIDTDKIAYCDLNIKDFGKCYNYYKDSNIDAPTIAQVLKWLREDKQFHVGIIFTGRDYTAWIEPLNDIDTQITIHDCDNNNEAAIAGIEYVLNNLI